jgi:hypothetical protein
VDHSSNMPGPVATCSTQSEYNPNQLQITAYAIMPGMIYHVWQLLHNDLTASTLGLFTATDTNVCTINTWGVGYFPFEMMEPLLWLYVTACQVFELVVLALVDVVLKYSCSSSSLMWP